MNYTDKGVYELKLKGRYEGSIYHFEVLRNDRLVKFKDPFSYSCVKDREESYVVDTRKLNFKNIKVSITSDPIIYELSVRDFSSDENAPFKHKGKFLSFTEATAPVEIVNATVAEFIAAEKSVTKKYRVPGTITEIQNPTYKI